MWKSCVPAICRRRVFQLALAMPMRRSHRLRLQRRNHRRLLPRRSDSHMRGSLWLCFARLSSFLLLAPAASTSASAEIQPADCARAAKYSEGKRGVSMLVMQNGRTIFERYANGGSARGRWAIFIGGKNFLGVTAVAAVHDGMF